MKKIRLEINNIEILKGREKWSLYFIIVIQHTDVADGKIIFTTPDIPIKTSKFQDNNIIFSAGKIGEEGKILFTMDMPENKEIRTSVYVMHSRNKARRTGGIIDDLKNGVGSGLIQTVAGVAGLSNPVTIIANSAIQIFSQIMKNQKDKQMGCITADESFDEDFISNSRKTYNRASNEIKMEYVWVVKDS